MSTPLKKQYEEIKRRYPGLILFFQIGDFYETFDEDAHIVARELGVVLTRKWFGKGDAHPLAGVPVRSLEAHLGKLIHRGYKVAVCDQVTLPGKGLVEREVVRVVTPGTVVEPGLLEGRSSNYLASLVVGDQRSGLAYADVTTGEFRVTELPSAEAIPELERLAPAELIVPRGLKLMPAEVREVGSITYLADEHTELGTARRALLSHFGAATLLGFGCEDAPLHIRAAGGIIAYLRETQPDALTNLVGLQRYQAERTMQLDPQTARHLEILSSADPSFGLGQGLVAGAGARAGSLVARLDLTETPMAARLLRSYLRRPSLDLHELRGRQDAVEWFFRRAPAREAVREALREVLDIERLLGRVRRRLAVPQEVIALGQSLAAAARVRAALAEKEAPEAFLQPLLPCDDIVKLIERALSDRPPQDFERGGIIRAGFSQELDALRATLGGGRRFLAELEGRERQRTGIRSLKVGYNKVFGYYIEVTRPNLRLVPADYVRKQTLTSAERFFTLELKEHESLIANAREHIREIETTLYRQLCDDIGGHHERIRQVAAGLGRLDLYAALSECAARFGYVRPELVEGDLIDIRGGRHPVVEGQLGEGQAFVPNDTRLDGDVRIMLLTAPNMAGKSVYLRQVALICVLGQIGSFVPASSARLGLVDRIFTRIGLLDSTLRGHSSFMSEMVETAHILHHATPRSLVLLDEIGRGTSTADGLAIARAVIEYLHNHPRLQCKTLFATHYHELCACADYLPRVRNFHLVVRETEAEVHYLHRVAPGRAEKSFGLHVARLAGLPRPVLRRARDLLGEYDQGRGAEQAAAPGQAGTAAGTAAWIDELLRLDINELSPVEALTRLYALQQQARKDRPAAEDGEVRSAAGK